MRWALTGIVTAAVALVAPSGALAKKPVDFRADVGESGVALEKDGLTLSASCLGSASQPIIRVFAQSAGRAQLTASMSQAGADAPITVHKPSLRRGQKIKLAESTGAPIGGTLNYTDAGGGQVSATFQLDAGDVFGGAYDCFVGGTSLKNTAIDYRADVGSKPRTLLTVGDDLKLRASCTGTRASPELDLILRRDPDQEEDLFGASWSQAGNPSALTTYGPVIDAGVDPLVGLEDGAAGTMVLSELFDPYGTLVFHSDEGRGALRADCMFGATFTQPSPTVVGLENFLVNNEAPAAAFGVAGFRGRLSCPEESVLGLSSGVADAAITASYSIENVPAVRTIHDGDADPGDPRLNLSAEGPSAGSTAVGTATFSTPTGRHVTANLANIYFEGQACVLTGTVSSTD